MGKPMHTNSNKKKRGHGGKSNRKNVVAEPKKTAAELVEIANEAMEALNVPKALLNYQAALPLLEEEEADNNNSQDLAIILTKLGDCKVSMGDQDGARDDFERAIALTPPGPKRAGLYLNVGQLSLEDDALEAHELGIADLQRCIAQYYEEEQEDDTIMTVDTDTDANNTTTSLKDLQQQLAKAHVTVAELYLTDLCFAENAEQTCELHVQKAMELCNPPLVDALQVMTSLRLSQQKEGATTYILQVYDQLKTGCEALATLVGLKEEDPTETSSKKDDEAVEFTEIDAADNLPGYEFRCQTAKLLLECASSSENESTTKQQCVQAAIHVLGSLLAEEDEVVEVWYLLGCAFDMMQQPTHPDLAQHYWESALQMLLKVQEQLKQEVDYEDDDDVLEQLTEVEGQIQEIQNKLQRLLEQEGGVVVDNENDDVEAMDE